MLISDWISDVFSSDLIAHCGLLGTTLILAKIVQQFMTQILEQPGADIGVVECADVLHGVARMTLSLCQRRPTPLSDRKVVEWGKSVEVSVDMGGCRSYNKKKQTAGNR